MSRQLEQGSEKLLKTALESFDCRLRAAALVAAARYDRRYLKTMIEHLADESPLVRQAGRTALIRISCRYCTSMPRIRDFGPPPTATPLECAAAAEMWRVWFSEHTLPIDVTKSLVKKTAR